MRLSLFGADLRLARLLGVAAVLAFASSVSAQSPAEVTAPSFKLPYSSYASLEARALFDHQLKQGPLPAGSSVQDSREYYGRQNSDRVRRMRAMYDVKVTQTSVGGVPVQRVTPSAGIAADNRGRILINLHGGAFMWGAGSGALAEAIPIAAVGKIEVITVDYREAPEDHFPAGSEDVAAVYRALLAKYRPGAVGIYGCSAGGFLTAESTAWILSKKLPRPGAIGTFCGSVVDFGGDSMFFGAAASGQAPGSGGLKMITTPYFAGARPDDPLVFPGVSRAVLSRFPPTLLITGTRDFAMSSVMHSNELLRAAGVETELRVWDGMPHAFFVDPESRESKEAYDAIAGFFLRHLSSGAHAKPSFRG